MKISVPLSFLGWMNTSVWNCWETIKTYLLGDTKVYFLIGFEYSKFELLLNLPGIELEVALHNAISYYIWIIICAMLCLNQFQNIRYPVHSFCHLIFIAQGNIPFANIFLKSNKKPSNKNFKTSKSVPLIIFDSFCIF